MAELRITHISDPGCPFAYSAMPFLTALRWRYGDQIEWRHVMIGLTEERRHYEERGYTPLRMAQSWRSFARFGMPFTRDVKNAVAATARACRLVIATRLTAPEREWELFRALQLTQFTTPLVLDTDEALRAAVARVPGLDADELLALLDSDAVTAAYEADRAEARTAEGGPTEFQGKAANTDGKVRFTAPSLLIESEDGRRLEVGGFQPLEAYDVAIANLDPTLTRREGAPSPGAVVEAFPYPLTTREISTCLLEGSLAVADDAATEDELLELVASGDVQAEIVGSGTLWQSTATRFTRIEAEEGVAAA